VTGRWTANIYFKEARVAIMNIIWQESKNFFEGIQNVWFEELGDNSGGLLPLLRRWMDDDGLMGRELESVGWVWRERESSGPSINPSCMRTAGRGISERAAGAHVAATRDEKSQNSRQGEHLRAHPRAKTCVSTFPLFINTLAQEWKRIVEWKNEVEIVSWK